MIGIENQVLFVFLGGSLRQVLLYMYMVDVFKF